MPSKVGVDSNVKDITGHEDNEKRDSEVDANGMESEMNVSDNGGVKDKFPNSEESLKRDGDREPLETTKLATDDLDSIEVEPDDPLLQAQTSAAEALTDMETIKRVFNGEYIQFCEYELCLLEHKGSDLRKIHYY